ncbi:MAG TPA: hypothetical protein VGK26_09785 [Thermoanaerobaculia bacterium]|jgi:hypothetical protein
MPCAIGLRAHAGWAAVVGVASGGSTELPEVVLRERIELTDPEIPGSKAPYHAAEKLGPDAAGFLARCEAASRALAQAGLERILDRLRSDGRAPARCGLLLAAGRPLPDLRATLASHALIHVGDGEHFRDALADGAGACGLEVRRVRERDVAASLDRLPGGVEEYLARQRRLLGPPWAQDQKLAALAAWFALRG